MAMDIQSILKKWQARLGLSDWIITIQFRDGRDMENCPARAWIQANTQHADIRLMNLSDRQACDPQDADPELDIVHELLHVRLWAINPNDAEGALYTCREQAIVALTRSVGRIGQFASMIKNDGRKIESPYVRKALEQILRKNGGGGEEYDGPLLEALENKFIKVDGKTWLFDDVYISMDRGGDTIIVTLNAVERGVRKKIPYIGEFPMSGNPDQLLANITNQIVAANREHQADNRKA